MIFVGDDWAEDSHQICVMDQAGKGLASVRLPEGMKGIAAFHELLAAHASDPAQVVVGIETDRGLWVGALLAAGYEVYGLNPKSVAAYRDRHRPGGGKSDRSDAKLLADLVRTDRHNHRPLAGDSPEVEAIKVLARTHQNLIWERKRHGNRLRSSLREYYPAALEAFDALTEREAVAVLAKAPDPGTGARLSRAQIRSALKAAGRQRNLEERAAQIQAGLRTTHLGAPSPVVAAFSATTSALVAIIAETNRQIEHLEQALSEHFEQHPDAAIYLSLPGIGGVTGARVLGELGDDPLRYSGAKSRRNYAGTSPLTIASGKGKSVIARHVRNHRLADALTWSAFASLSRSPGCRAFYDQRRQKGDTHFQALRALANRLVGILDGCLRTRSLYDEDIAWGHRQPGTENIAA